MGVQAFLEDIDHLPAGAQPGERKGRFLPAGDHQVDLSRKVIQQQRDRGVNLRRMNLVVVVEHQDEFSRRARQRVRQLDQPDFKPKN